jgi:acyl-coenzyme A synthetase/AMP-(fatty) acid ligase
VNGGAAAKDTLIDEISALCRANLPAHKVPSRITIVDELTVTPGGKLARNG